MILFQTLKMPVPENQEEDLTMEEITSSLPEFLGMSYQILITHIQTMETSQPLANIDPLKVLTIKCLVFALWQVTLIRAQT